MKNKIFSCFIFLLFILAGCKTTRIPEDSKAPGERYVEKLGQKQSAAAKDEITLLFAGDLMAHSVNYNVSSYSKIWADIESHILSSDFAFANIESPIDETKEVSSYPNFNTNQKYIQAAINAGFNVFSLCNNHTNDQLQEGIKETIKSTKALTEKNDLPGRKVYFSGIKEKSTSPFTYNLIKKNGWKIVFLPITELLNRPQASSYINYVSPDETSRKQLYDYIKKLNKENPNDLFILSVHTAEPEYTREITEAQEDFYKELLDCGVDVIWANHPHIIKDRKYIFNTQDGTQKVIMYANGNIISGQRTRPDFVSKNPVGERDNTGDGLMVKITFSKNKNKPKPEIKTVENIFITTYINTAWEYVVKPLDKSFADYLWDIPRKDWAAYIEKRIKINSEYTKDLIEWQ